MDSAPRIPAGRGLKPTLGAQSVLRNLKSVAIADETVE
jgi:hypothetical protein